MPPTVPSVEAQELVTKDFLRAELADLRTELTTGLSTGIGGLRAELRTEAGLLRAEMAALESRLTTRLGAALGTSTALLGAIGLLT